MTPLAPGPGPQELRGAPPRCWRPLLPLSFAHPKAPDKGLSYLSKLLSERLYGLGLQRLVGHWVA